jgi:TonB family protein
MTRILFFALAAVAFWTARPALADVPPSPPDIACSGKPVRLVPISATHTFPPYPPIAQRLNEQGTTLLTVTIAPDGAVAETTVFQSSGSERLDTAAMEHVKQNWRWQPTSCSVPMQTRISITWHLAPRPQIDPAVLAKVVHFIAAPPDAWPTDVPKVKSVVMLGGAINDKGEWESIMPMIHGNPALLEKSKAVIAAHHWTPAQMDGKRIGSIVMVGVLWTPPGETPVDPDQVSKVMEMFLPGSPLAQPSPKP